FLDDLELVLASTVAARGCFRSHVRGAAGSAAGNLLLRVSIDVVRDEVSYDASIAARSSPASPPERRRQQEATVQVEFLAELRLPDPGGAVVRSEHYRRRISYRPVLEEDPRAAALDEMATAVARTVRSFACHGSEKRFQRELARAEGD